MTIGYTPYSQRNQEFSNKAHARAQTDVYPLIFESLPESLTFTALPEEQAMTLDGDMGTDRLVEVRVKGLMAPLTYLVQERFRRPEVARYDDITITEWNHNSNRPSELYKIKAGLFLYGKYDEKADRFTEATCFSVCPVLLQLTRGRLHFERRQNKKNQTFIAIKTTALNNLGLLDFHKKWDTGVQSITSQWQKPVTYPQQTKGEAS